MDSWALNTPTGPIKREKLSQKGEALYRELLKINTFYLSAGKTIELPRYKFYTGLVDMLLIQYRREGAQIFDHLLGIRSNLLKDLKFEKKLLSFAAGASYEMGIIFVLGIAFVLFAKSFVGLEISVSACFIAFGWQALGAILFFFSYARLKERTFRPFGDYLRGAALLELGLKTNRPLSCLTKDLNLEDLANDPELNHIRARMDEILQLVKNKGSCHSSHTKELGTECWFSYERKMDEFEKRTKSVKLGVIALFFLTGYLGLFYSLLTSLGQGH